LVVLKRNIFQKKQIGKSTICRLSFTKIFPVFAEIGLPVPTYPQIRITKLLIGSVLKDPPTPVTLSGTRVERVTTFRLLGVHVVNDLKWAQHVEAISSEAASRLHFLKQLKRSGAGQNDLLCFYGTVIRPFESHGITIQDDQSDTAEGHADNICRQ